MHAISGVTMISRARQLLAPRSSRSTIRGDIVRRRAAEGRAVAGRPEFIKKWAVVLAPAAAQSMQMRVTPHGSGRSGSDAMPSCSNV